LTLTTVQPAAPPLPGPAPPPAPASRAQGGSPPRRVVTSSAPGTTRLTASPSRAMSSPNPTTGRSFTQGTRVHPGRAGALLEDRVLPDLQQGDEDAQDGELHAGDEVDGRGAPGHLRHHAAQADGEAVGAAGGAVPGQHRAVAGQQGALDILVRGRALAKPGALGGLVRQRRRSAVHRVGRSRRGAPLRRRRPGTGARPQQGGPAPRRRLTRRSRRAVSRPAPRPASSRPAAGREPLPQRSYGHPVPRGRPAWSSSPPARPAGSGDRVQLREHRRPAVADRRRRRLPPWAPQPQRAEHPPPGEARPLPRRGGHGRPAVAARRRGPRLGLGRRISMNFCVVRRTLSRGRKPAEEETPE
jgi:hypothetical protein